MKPKPRKKLKKRKAAKRRASDLFTTIKGRAIEARTGARARLALEEIANGRSIIDAIRNSGFSWHEWNAVVSRYPGLAEQYAIARKSGGDIRQIRREDAMDKRGIEGWQEPVFSYGQEVGQITRYSDNLLIKSLAAHDPEKYADRVRQEHSGTGGGPIAMCSFPPEPKTAEEWEAMWKASREKTESAAGT